MLRITSSVWLDLHEIELSYIRSPGPGGQNVNKLATSVLLRFNLPSSSLPPTLRERLSRVLANKLTQHGDVIIKASRHRTQERNRQDALDRLAALLAKAAIPQKARKKTKPTRASVERRLDKKKLKSRKKVLRGKYLD